MLDRYDCSESREHAPDTCHSLVASKDDDSAAAELGDLLSTAAVVLDGA